jgi:ABC-2 type transport system ATP-binding protein
MISIEHLQKTAGQNTLLNIEHLAVGAGEVAAVLGPDTADKAALFSLLTGQARPTAGTVRVAGLDPARERARLNRQIGVLFLENGHYERLSARANLEFYCRLCSLPLTRADEVLDLVGLADQASVSAGKLNDNLARRLAVGRAILHKPPVLLLMEPFARCDEASVSLLLRVLQELAASGTTILLLVRENTGLADLCQQVYEMAQGRITRVYNPQEGRQGDLPFKIPARLEAKVALLNPADILYASAEDDRTLLHTAEGEVPTHLNLAELEERLGHSGFFRAHRAYLVNLQRVKAVIPYTRDSFTLVLDDATGTEIPLSKTSARELRELLGY